MTFFYLTHRYKIPQNRSIGKWSPTNVVNICVFNFFSKFNKCMVTISFSCYIFIFILFTYESNNKSLFFVAVSMRSHIIHNTFHFDSLLKLWPEKISRNYPVKIEFSLALGGKTIFPKIKKIFGSLSLCAATIMTHVVAHA